MKVVNRLKNPYFMEFGNVIINNYYVPNNWFDTFSSHTPLALLVTRYHAHTFDRCVTLQKQGTGNSSIGQIVDFKYDIEGYEFDMGMWIKITQQTGDSGVRLIYQWLDSEGSLIGSEQVIAERTAVQNYTLHSVSDVVAPATAQRIRFRLQTIGDNQPMLVWVDSPYIYGGKQYGLKIKDAIGNSSLILDNITSIVSAGTETLPSSLEADETYGEDIVLPGTEYISTDDISVFVQTRDFDWNTLINVVAYDSGKKYWGNFFANTAIDYYEKQADNTMVLWTSGDMTDVLLNVSLSSHWDRLGTSIRNVRLFSGVLYNFSTSIAGSSENINLYARNYGIENIGSIGYALTTSQGATERGVSIQSSPAFTIHWSTETWFNIYVLHADGSETALATNVGYHEFDEKWGGEGTREGQYSVNWSCPGYAGWARSDSLKFNMFIRLKANDWPLGLNQQTITSSAIPFITPSLNWGTLEASTWSLSRYIHIYQMWEGAGVVTASVYFGTALKEVKAENILAEVSVPRERQTVYSIGVVDVDYIISQKHYKGE